MNSNASTNILKKGEVISIIAPASGFVEVKTIQSMKQKFNALGYKLNIPNDLLKETLFCANTDSYRAEHLLYSLTHKSSNIIWALRGGYGCARILHSLSKIEKPAHVKTLIGFSDITALHLYISQKWGWQTIHGAVAKQMTEAVDPDNFKLLFNLLTTDNYEIKMPIEKQLNKVKYNSITGKLTGGNLAIVQTSIGTDWELEGKDKIIFLEEVNEEGYRVDRMLEHLKQSGILKGAKAIIFGEFLDKANQDFKIMDALNRFAASVDIPVFKTKYFGHGYHNYPLIYNALAEITNDSKGIILKYSKKKY